MAFNNVFHAPIGQVIQVETLYGDICFNQPGSNTELNEKLKEVINALEKAAHESPQIPSIVSEIKTIQQDAQQQGQDKEHIQQRIESVADTISKVSGATDSLVKIGKALGKWAAMAVAFL